MFLWLPIEYQTKLFQQTSNCNMLTKIMKKKHFNFEQWVLLLTKCLVKECLLWGHHCDTTTTYVLEYGYY